MSRANLSHDGFYRGTSVRFPASRRGKRDISERTGMRGEKYETRTPGHPALFGVFTPPEVLIRRLAN